MVRDDRCIFHLEDKTEAEADEFEKSFTQELERLEQTESEIDLIGFIFAKQISLQITFTKNVYFNQATFKQDVDFTNAKFLGNAWFGGTKFLGDAEFTGARFSGNAMFGRAEFSGNVSFEEAKFSGYAWYDGAKFSGDAWYDAAEFSSDASFDGAEFMRDAAFGAEFLGDARFTGAKFSETDFSSSSFSRAAIFTGCSFGKLANFGFATFDGQAQFVKGEKDETDPILLFYSVIFKMPRATQFCGYPLSKISFAATDITDILLVPTKGDQDRILDEVLINSPFSASGDDPLDEAKRAVGGLVSSYGLIAEYKLLRKCLEGNRMFTEAADIFVREMKLSRKRLTWRDFGEITTHILYSGLSRYGESINRPIFLSFLTVVLTTIILQYAYSFAMPDPWSCLTAITSVFFQIKSFKDFTFLNSVPLTLEIFLRLVSLTLLGNFYIALKRRMERK